MVTELTPDELQRLRRKIGDSGDPPVFEESELQDIWTETEGNWNKAVLTCYDELIASSYKFHNYTQNQSRDEKKQVFDNLLKVREVWQKKVDADLSAAAAKNQVRLTALGVRKRVKRTD
jgi:hypothetical protein